MGLGGGASILRPQEIMGFGSSDSESLSIFYWGLPRGVIQQVRLSLSLSLLNMIIMLS